MHSFEPTSDRAKAARGIAKAVALSCGLWLLVGVGVTATWYAIDEASMTSVRVA